MAYHVTGKFMDGETYHEEFQTLHEAQADVDDIKKLYKQWKGKGSDMDLVNPKTVMIRNDHVR